MIRADSVDSSLFRVVTYSLTQIMMNAKNKGFAMVSNPLQSLAGYGL